MKKKFTLGIIIVIIMMVSTWAAFSYQGRYGSRLKVWDKEKIVTIEGKITDAERPVITMESNGKIYILHAGPYRFWKEKGFELENGQMVRVTGIVEEVNDKLNLYPQKIESEGKTALVLSDESGTPLWRGQGRHGNRGNCPVYGKNNGMRHGFRHRHGL